MRGRTGRLGEVDLAQFAVTVELSELDFECMGALTLRGRWSWRSYFLH